MKAFKRNMVILTVLMFVCVAVYLNWSYNRGQEVPLSGNESGNEAANIIIQNESEKPSDKAQEEQSEDAGLYYVDEAEQTGGQSDEDYYSSYFAGKDTAAEITEDSPCEFGLYRSTVGEDIEKTDFFEHYV